MAQVFATSMTMRTASPFSSHSAAALFGLPLYRFNTARAQVLVSHRTSATSTKYVERRVAPCDDTELSIIGGVRCTDLERTVLDLARFETLERALACADAAIRLRFPADRGHEIPVAAQSWQQSLVDPLGGMRGARGVKRAAEVIRLADGGADSPLESVARLRFITAGYRVATQVRVPSRTRGNYYVDLELLGLGILCEVDGKVKYTNAGMRRGMNADEVVYAEKRRSNWIEGQTGMHVVRLGAPEVRTQESFTRWLRDFNVPPPPG